MNLTEIKPNDLLRDGMVHCTMLGVFFFILQAVLADLTTLQVIPLIQLSLFSK